MGRQTRLLEAMDVSSPTFSRPGAAAPQDFLKAVSLQPDGKILVGGHSNAGNGSSGNYVHAMARYQSNGTLDTSFGQSGKSVFSLSSSSFALEQITDLQVLSDGKILATSGVRSETALVKLLSNGSLDTSFGSAGRIIAPNNAPWKDPNALLVDDQGRMLLGNSDSFSVTRLLPDGSVDNSFGTNGTFDIDVGSTFRTNVTSLDWAPNGDLLMGGYSVVTANVDSDWHVARLQIGPPDPTQTITLVPTFDVKAIPGPMPSLTEGETGLSIGLGFNDEFPEERPIMEFSLESIPENAMITAASLALDPYGSSGSPRIEVLGYAGDGLASISDIDAPGSILATTGPVDAGMSSIETALSPEFIQSLLGESTHLGLRLRSLNVPLYVSIRSTEASFGSPPQLSLTYTVPAPGDFNKDGMVNSQDLAVWENAYGSSVEGDADADGDTDGQDFLIWQRNLSAALAGLKSADPVPEPSSVCLLTFGILLLGYRSRQ